MEDLQNAIHYDSWKHTLTTRGETLAINVVAALAIFVVGRMVARMAAAAISAALERSRTDATLVRFINNLVYALMLVFVVVAAIEKLGVNTTSFAAVVAAAGLAIGLALQGSLSNFAAGVMIIIHRHFTVGDRIEAGGQVGTVTEVQIFSSVLRGDDGSRIIVPNSAVVGGVIKVLPKTDDKSKAA